LTYFSMRTPGINPLVFSTTKTLLSLETFAIWSRYPRESGRRKQILSG
jgi:hypothetical protein